MSAMDEEEEEDGVAGGGDGSSCSSPFATSAATSAATTRPIPIPERGSQDSPGPSGSVERERSSLGNQILKGLGLGTFTQEGPASGGSGSQKSKPLLQVGGPITRAHTLCAHATFS